MLETVEVIRESAGEAEPHRREQILLKRVSSQGGRERGGGLCVVLDGVKGLRLKLCLQYNM